MNYIHAAGATPNGQIAAKLVWDYFIKNIDNTYNPTLKDIENVDVYEVWHCYILGNEKWLLATTYPDGMYYEVTYNKAKDEWYFDAYLKVKNIKVSSDIIDNLI